MEAVDALARLGGVASLADLLKLTSRKRLRTAVRRDLVRHVGHGRYALPAADQARRVAALCDGHVSHLSAAMHWGWEVRFPPRKPQVGILAGRSLPRVAAAEVRSLPPRVPVEGWATAPVSTVLLCARDLPFVDALTVADSALRSGRVSKEDLVTAAQGQREQHVARYADGRSANPFESSLRALAVEEGLGVIPQYEVRARDLVLHPDVVDPIAGVVLEAESWEFHGRDKAAFERDCERYNALVATGWRVLRFTWRQVMLEPEVVRDCIREVYAQPLA